MTMAKGWPKIDIITDNGEKVTAQSPLIVSASRSTDIPAFYSDWFLERLKVGYTTWRNPFNGVKNYISYKNTHFIVFWSKNPRPLITSGLLDYLEERHIHCYVQYSLNNYEAEGLESGIPSLDYRLETFDMLVQKLGVGSVIWRFDPLIMTDKISGNTLLHRLANIAEQLKRKTDKLVFSFADIFSYKRVKRNLENDNIHYKDWTEEQMKMFASKLAEYNQEWRFRLATCAEKIDLKPYGIEHNKCIDDDLIIRIAYNDAVLMNFLGVDIRPKALTLQNDENTFDLGNGFCAVKTKDLKDHGQRQFCGCIISKDIGQYNTCAHKCEYCYANTSMDTAIENLKKHKENPYAESITGE